MGGWFHSVVPAECWRPRPVHLSLPNPVYSVTGWCVLPQVSLKGAPLRSVSSQGPLSKRWAEWPGPLPLPNCLPPLSLLPSSLLFIGSGRSLSRDDSRLTVSECVLKTQACRGFCVCPFKLPKGSRTQSGPFAPQNEKFPILPSLNSLLCTLGQLKLRHPLISETPVCS